MKWFGFGPRAATALAAMLVATAERAQAAPNLYYGFVVLPSTATVSDCVSAAKNVMTNMGMQEIDAGSDNATAYDEGKHFTAAVSCAVNARIQWAIIMVGGDYSYDNNGSLTLQFKNRISDKLKAYFE